MVSDIRYFVDMRDAPIRSVTCGGGEKHDVLGIGTVTLQTPDDFVRLKALCVPTLKANLVSWPTAKRVAGLQMLGTADNLNISRNGDVWVKATYSPVHGLPVIDGHFMFQKAVACATIGMETWHRRLGHPGQGVMKKMKDLHKVAGMAFDASEGIPDCTVCI